MDGPTIWAEYASLVLHPILAGTVILVSWKILRAAFGWWFYLE